METWTLLQLADSAFPTGGFAHSAGLEAAQQLGRVRRPEDLLAFVEEALWSTGSFGLPFVRAARADPAAHLTLDATCDAATPGRVANRASRDQGQAFLRAAAVFSPATSHLAEEARRQRRPGHLAPAFGAVLGLLGAGEEETCQVFLYLGARGIVSAAVRLGVVGPVEGQALLARAAPVLTAVLRCPNGAGPRDAASSSPVLDLLQEHQGRLYSRLFRS